MTTKKSSIIHIEAREILDSRGNPTVEVAVKLGGGVRARAGVPSGASTGASEALELRDGDRKRYRGKGVLKAVRNVEFIAKKLKGKDATDQQGIDAALLVMDGTANKTKLGANALLGVSLACARAAAQAQGRELFEHIRDLYQEQAVRMRSSHKAIKPYGSKAFKMPVPMFNILNGGAHANNGLDIQEIMVVPLQGAHAAGNVRMGAEIFHALGVLLKEHHQSTAVGDEGGYAPQVEGVKQAMRWVTESIVRAGYRAGRDAALALDVAASGFFDEHHRQYKFKIDENFFTSDQMISLYHEWLREFPLMSLEDPLFEEDWEGWATLAHELASGVEKSRKGNVLLTRKRATQFKPMIVGDDLFTTNVGRLERGIVTGAANAVIVKPNQVGTLTETLAFAKLAEEHGWPRIVSHRSGETNDDSIVDIAVGMGAEYLKAGAPSRGERVAKYNRLMEIDSFLKH